MSPNRLLPASTGGDVAPSHSSRSKVDSEFLDGDNVFLESDGSGAEDVGQVEELAPVDDEDEDLFAGLLSDSSVD